MKQTIAFIASRSLPKFLSTVSTVSEARENDEIELNEVVIHNGSCVDVPWCTVKDENYKLVSKVKTYFFHGEQNEISASDLDILSKWSSDPFLYVEQIDSKIKSIELEIQDDLENKNVDQLKYKLKVLHLLQLLKV
jgi:hypothetical protein